MLVKGLRVFQSTPPVRGETLLSRLSGKKEAISIHSPRAGGDLFLPIIQPFDA